MPNVAAPTEAACPPTVEAWSLAHAWENRVPAHAATAKAKRLGGAGGAWTQAGGNPERIAGAGRRRFRGDRKADSIRGARRSAVLPLVLLLKAMRSRKRQRGSVVSRPLPELVLPPPYLLGYPLRSWGFDRTGKSRRYAADSRENRRRHQLDLQVAAVSHFRTREHHRCAA